MKFVEGIKKHTLLFSLFIGFAIFLYGHFFHTYKEDYSDYFILISLVSPFCAVFFSRRKLSDNILIGIAITFLIIVGMSIFWSYMALLVKPSFSFENEAPLIQVIFYSIASTLAGLLLKLIRQNKKSTHLKILLTILLVVWVALYVKESLTDKVLYLCPTFICSTYKTSLPRDVQINIATPSPRMVDSSHTTEWNTFYDTTLGFTFEYPPQWDVLPRGSAGIMIAPIDRIAEAKKITGPHDGGKFDTFTIYTNFTGTAPVSNEFYSVVSENVKIDQINATKYTLTWLKNAQSIEAGDKTIQIVIFHNRKRYVISLEDSQYESTFNQILSTFKFIE